MKTVLVRYQVKPEFADENQRLVEQVFAQLAQEKPAGLRYQAFRLSDGVSFAHVASHEGAGGTPLVRLEAFRAFAAGIEDRCQEPPVAVDMEPIGRYDAQQPAGVDQ